jgi:hypothetical protein
MVEEELDIRHALKLVKKAFIQTSTINCRYELCPSYYLISKANGFKRYPSMDIIRL